MEITLNDSIVINKVMSSQTIAKNNTSSVVQEYKIGDEGTWSMAPPALADSGEKIYTRFKYTYLQDGVLSYDYVPSEQGQEDASWQMLQSLQGQMDGEIITWFGEGTPTIGKLTRDPETDEVIVEGAIPDEEWNTEQAENTIKKSHLGDIYYASSGENEGSAYRFTLKRDEEGNETYSWELIKDTMFASLSEKVFEAQKTADGKITVFYGDNEPQAAEEDDLWAKNKQVTLIKKEDGEYYEQLLTKLNKI